MSARLSSVPLAAPPKPAHILEDGIRLDGRGFEEFRPVFVNTKVVTQAAGSAYAEFGSTKVMVAVYGPRQGERKLGFSESGRLNFEVSFTAWARRAQDTSRQLQIASERELAALMAAALEPSVMLDAFPKAVVDVCCMVLESGGGDAAVAVTAASVALADAGLALYDLVPACTLSAHEGRLLLDPTILEASREQGGLLLAMMPSANEVTQVVMTGSWGEGLTRDALELAMGGCTQLKALMREALLAPS